MVLVMVAEIMAIWGRMGCGNPRGGGRTRVVI